MQSRRLIIFACLVLGTTHAKAHRAVDVLSFRDLDREARDLSKAFPSREAYHRALRNQDPRLAQFRNRLWSFLESSEVQLFFQIPFDEFRLLRLPGVSAWVPDALSDYRSQIQSARRELWPEDPAQALKTSPPVLTQLALEYSAAQLYAANRVLEKSQETSTADRRLEVAEFCAGFAKGLRFLSLLNASRGLTPETLFEPLHGTLFLYHVTQDHLFSPQHECDGEFERGVPTAVLFFMKDMAPLEVGSLAKAGPFVREQMLAHVFRVGILERFHVAENLDSPFDYRWLKLETPSPKPVDELLTLNEALKVWYERSQP